MSDIPFNPFPRIGSKDEYEDWVKSTVKPDSAVDLLDPGQAFQGDFHSKELQEEEIARVEKEEKAKVEQEKKERERKKLEAQRKERKTRAGRKGRRASIVTGPLGVQEQETVRRASLGAA